MQCRWWQVVLVSWSSLLLAQSFQHRPCGPSRSPFSTRERPASPSTAAFRLRTARPTLMMAIQRPRRVVPPPAGAGALEIRVCNDPNKACGPKGGNAVIALMEEACNAGEDTERAYVQRTGCVDKCAFGVACVAGWEDEHGEFQRAGVQRPADDPLMDPRHALALSGVWSKVEAL
mmetsp:Transcript_34896/g.71235  ORF Transcript_34896/g.71235 Transcript_34896/m.71235 type:complete len:175 (+) Transcript_34896:79-603(+)